VFALRRLDERVPRPF